jgi:hypothetical protein
MPFVKSGTEEGRCPSAYQHAEVRTDVFDFARATDKNLSERGSSA